MPLEVWLLIALPIALGGLLLGNSPLAALGFLVGAVATLSWVWNRLSLYGVEYHRLFSERRAFQGERVRLTIRLSNKKLIPLPWLEVEDLFPEGLRLTGMRIARSHIPTLGLLGHLTSLRWFEGVSWSYDVSCQARGYYRFGPAQLRSGDLFGFFHSERREGGIDHLLVYPRTVPLSQLGLPSRQPFGDVRGRELLFEDPDRPMGVRDYRESDPWKRIHWKASARRQALQVKVYEPSITLHLVIILNADTFEHSWQGSNPELLEQMVVAAASVARYASEHHYALGLLTNAWAPGSDLLLRVPPRQHPEQLGRVLEALALLTPHATSPFPHLLERETRGLPWGATLVVVTAPLSEPILAALAALRASGYRVALVSPQEMPLEASLRGIAAYSMRPLAGEEDALHDAQA